MATQSIPVDLFNPGQVFACLGIMELAEVLCGPTRSGFDWSDGRHTRFVLSAEATAPIDAALRFLSQAEVHALAPRGSELDTSKWKLAFVVSNDASFPIPAPSAPANLPAVMTAGGVAVSLSSWGDHGLPKDLTGGRDNAKFWAGAGGMPGAAILRDALDLARAEIEQGCGDPFAFSAPQSGSYRFDWRRDYIPLDAGFSLNHHSSIIAGGYPLVEILAAIGISHSRPRRLEKLRYQYAILGRSDARQAAETALLPPMFLRAALGTASLPFPKRTFTMHLNWPGQVGQARCITTVSEENQ